MIRDVVGTFLDTLTEREFDGPLLSLLAARGFTDIHFIHGAFEFGKDVLAKKVDPETGDVRQFVIQSKAGDIGQSEWRAIRPQLEECEYNTLGHPSFNGDLPRVAVLVTTGRLKGAAPSDVAEYRKSVKARGLADLEIWTRSDLVTWFCTDPTVGVGGDGGATPLLSALVRVLDGSITDGQIEEYARRWHTIANTFARGAVEASILINALVRNKRLDLALSVGLQLARATEQDPAASEEAKSAARRLILSIASRIRDQVEPLSNDPLELVRRVRSPMAMITYPVVCLRAAEALALGLLLARACEDDQAVSRFEQVMRKFIDEPGAARPPGDLFAASVVTVTVMLGTLDSEAARSYLRRVALWVLDRYDDDQGGLGLAALHEDERTTAERLLGGSLTSTTVDRRSSSYLTTVVLDLALHLDARELYEAVMANVKALKIAPETTKADETKALWARHGHDVWPTPRVDFASWDVQCQRSRAVAPADPVSALLLAAACRSRHYPGGWGALNLPHTSQGV